MFKLLSNEIDRDEQDSFWLALKQINQTQNHCGVQYRGADNEVRMLHLAFHCRLTDDQVSNSYAWTTCSIDEVNQKFLSALVANMARTLPAIPYGFDYEGMVFDKLTGDLLDGASIGQGFTCATFILALLNTYGFRVLLPGTWPTRDTDVAWQEYILAAIRQLDAKHADDVNLTLPAKRIRPEEVVASINYSSSAWPLAFAEVLPLAEIAREKLAAFTANLGV